MSLLKYMIIIWIITFDTIYGIGVCSKNSKDKSKCPNKYSFQCEKDHCSVNKEACENFHFLKITLASYFSIKMHMVQFKKHREQINSVKACPLEPVVEKTIENKVLPSDFCINGLSCISRQTLKFPKGIVNILKPKTCPCKGEFKYRCNMNYCATSKIKCNLLLLQKNFKTQKTFFNQIGSCVNGNSTVF